MTDQRFTDAQIRAAFEARAAGSPSPELALQIAGATRRVRQQPRLTLLPGGLGRDTQRLLWAATIAATSLAIVGGLMFAGRQNDDQTSVPPTATPTEAPSGVPEPTPSGAPSPTVAPTPPVEPSEAPVVDPVFGADDTVVTLVGALRVRSLPTVGESSARLEPLLPAGLRLLVIEDAVHADGYAWYHVIPLDPGYPAGWVAAGSREGDAWIAPDETPCPALPIAAAELADLTTFGGLACFGDQEIQLTGDVFCEIADVDRSISGPTWLSNDHYCTLDLGDSTMEILDGGLGLGTSGGGIDAEGFPMTWLGATITGHFDDPESSTCTYGLEEQPAPDSVEVIATCQAMFVATSLE
jgi:hypothetical protein